MILNEQEAQITSQILKRVFDADISADQIRGIQMHRIDEETETVVIVTSFALYSLGKAYFRELVIELKPVTKKPKPQRQAESVTLLNSNGANSIWQVIGETSNVYLVGYNSRTDRANCGCKAASFGRSCYHALSVQQHAAQFARQPEIDSWQQSNDELTVYIEEQAEALAPTRYRTPAKRGISSKGIERHSDAEIQAQNQRFARRGMKVMVDDQFDRMMGSVSQVCGAAMRELRKKALFA